MKTLDKRILDIKETLTWDEYLESDYPTRECENFGYEHLMKKELLRWGKYSPQVIISNQEKEFNYGLDFKVYLLYTVDGLNFFKSINYGSSSISNRGFRTISSLSFFMTKESYETMYAHMEVEKRPSLRWSSVLVSEDAYANDERTRKYFRENNHYILTSEF